MWSIEYYRSEAGRLPVVEFIDAQDAKSRAKIARIIDLLEQLGIELGMPSAKPVQEQLWELRIRHARNQYRIIYFLAVQQKFVLLHAFAKKTNAISRKDVELAQTRMNDYISRQGTK